MKLPEVHRSETAGTGPSPVTASRAETCPVPPVPLLTPDERLPLRTLLTSDERLPLRTLLTSDERLLTLALPAYNVGRKQRDCGDRQLARRLRRAWCLYPCPAAVEST